MVRIIVKGGVWKNTEDEILKAAVSKYGKNQWARISSLLVRKSAKQCKARWYEWLDPSIKKVEWSKEEDEKLLHLAKLMPTQWRTIAPIVGRTATQCLERYQRLLDDSEALDGGDLALAGPGAEAAAPTADTVRRLRPGEIDPDPETKPAQPDPIDMDEDEKEMLSEARARLANTEGKKAKRKARERALEEARRLATLQKRRELKVAGIFTRGRGKKTAATVDYNAEVPFEKQPAPGFYDTTEELTRTYDAPLGRSIRSMETGGRSDVEDAKRKRQAEKKSDKPTGNEDTIRRLREADQIAKRRRLALPAVQVGERELEQIAKLGHAGETAKALVQGDGPSATHGLLGDYAALERAKEARTPQAPDGGADAVLREARALKQRSEMQTPLLGDENTPLPAPRDDERHAAAATPNPLLTPHGARRDADGAPPGAVAASQPSTPGATPLPTATPLRDSLGLNADATPVPASPRSPGGARHALRAGLQSLPAPKNDFELVVDGGTDDAAPPRDAAQPHAAAHLEDASIREARAREAAAEAHARAFARRTQVVQRGLPRPVHAEAAQLRRDLDALRLADADASEAQQLVDEEVVRLMEHDATEFPLPGSRVVGGRRSALPPLSDEAMALARAVAQKQLAQDLGFPGAREDALQAMLAGALDGDASAAFDRALDDARAHFVWHPERRAWVSRATVDARVVVAGQAALLAEQQGLLTQQAGVAAKTEKTLGKLLGGYQARAASLSGKLRDTAAEYAEKSLALAAFERLAVGEDAAAADRLERVQRAVAQLQAAEGVAQNDYRANDARRAAAREEYEMVLTEVEMRRAEAELGAA
ncbi:Pre-mRNA-splicing factor cef1 [Malassezia sp. CBS 17886]|nr:Pre-mRNA-splicing factor cef1 [Malassezia sp. CBS 17886]